MAAAAYFRNISAPPPTSYPPLLLSAHRTALEHCYTLSRIHWAAGHSRSAELSRNHAHTGCNLTEGAEGHIRRLYILAAEAVGSSWHRVQLLEAVDGVEHSQVEWVDHYSDRKRDVVAVVGSCSHHTARFLAVTLVGRNLAVEVDGRSLGRSFLDLDRTFCVYSCCVFEELRSKKVQEYTTRLVRCPDRTAVSSGMHAW